MVNLKGRDLLSIADLNKEEIREILNLAASLKRGKNSTNVIRHWAYCFTKPPLALEYPLQ